MSTHLAACSLTDNIYVFGKTTPREQEDKTGDSSRTKSDQIVTDKVQDAPFPPITPTTLKAARELMRNNAELLKLCVRNGRDLAPQMAEVLTEEGVPDELLAVVMVETRFKRSQRSSRGAGGLWQFMPATARSLGLRVSTFHDDRKSPILSTRAAARYLLRHYREFGSFELSLAAYNAGAGRVRSALKKHGVSTFWELYERRALPTQTLQYVPKVLVAMLAVRRLNILHWQVSEEQWDFVSARVSTFIDLAEKAPA